MNHKNAKNGIGHKVHHGFGIKRDIQQEINVHQRVGRD